MTFLDAMKIKYPEMIIGSDELTLNWLAYRYCPAQFFGAARTPCEDVPGGRFEPFQETEASLAKCRECWLKEYENDFSCAMKFREKHGFSYFPIEVRELVGDLMRGGSPARKALALRVAREILYSERSLEYFDVGQSKEYLKKVLTHYLWKNRVSTEDGRAFLLEMAEEYRGK